MELEMLADSDTPECIRRGRRPDISEVEGLMMEETFFEKVLRLLDAEMETPPLYGWFHLLAFAVVIAATVVLCRLHRKARPEKVSNTVLVISLLAILLEIYKQINFNLAYGDGLGVRLELQLYCFPWQFCSTPMYAGLLAGLTRKGRVHDAMCAYLATYSVFAGACVMFYPGDVFVSTIGINIQTMFCHGSMLVIGVYLFVTGHVRAELRTMLKAIPVFVAFVIIAIILNEAAYYTGLLEEHEINMFYISRHCEPHLPVYSSVQEMLPYPLCLIAYILGFSAAAFVILLAAMGTGKLASHRKTQQNVAA